MNETPVAVQFIQALGRATLAALRALWFALVFTIGLVYGLVFGGGNRR